MLRVDKGRLTSNKNIKVTRKINLGWIFKDKLKKCFRIQEILEKKALRGISCLKLESSTIPDRSSTSYFQ